MCVCVCEGISSWGVRNSRGSSRARFTVAVAFFFFVRWKVMEGSSPGDCDGETRLQRERESVCVCVKVSVAGELEIAGEAAEHASLWRFGQCGGK